MSAVNYNPPKETRTEEETRTKAKKLAERVKLLRLEKSEAKQCKSTSVDTYNSTIFRIINKLSTYLVKYIEKVLAPGISDTGIYFGGQELVNLLDGINKELEKLPLDYREECANKIEHTVFEYLDKLMELLAKEGTRSQKSLLFYSNIIKIICERLNVSDFEQFQKKLIEILGTKRLVDELKEKEIEEYGKYSNIKGFLPFGHKLGNSGRRMTHPGIETELEGVCAKFEADLSNLSRGSIDNSHISHGRKNRKGKKGKKGKNNKKTKNNRLKSDKNKSKKNKRRKGSRKK